MNTLSPASECTYNAELYIAFNSTCAAQGRPTYPLDYRLSNEQGWWESAERNVYHWIEIVTEKIGVQT